MELTEPMELLEYAKLALAVALPLCVVAGLIYTMMRSALADMRTDIKADMERIERKVDKLSDVHGALARGLSEVKGYLRGTQPEYAA